MNSGSSTKSFLKRLLNFVWKKEFYYDEIRRSKTFGAVEQWILFFFWKNKHKVATRCKSFVFRKLMLSRDHAYYERFKNLFLIDCFCVNKGGINLGQVNTGIFLFFSNKESTDKATSRQFNKQLFFLCGKTSSLQEFDVPVYRNVDRDINLALRT